MEQNDREPDVRYEFDSTTRAPAQARRALREVLAEAGDPIADDVTLAASELVANAVQHAHSGGEMRVWDPKPDVPLRLEVEDSDPTLPTPSADAPPPWSITGRGLRIVRDVSDACGAVRTRVGKVVWAEFDRLKRRAH